MNKKGFTLIELLVTLVVITFIMMIVMPSATRISKENETKMYEEYEKMMVEYARISSKQSENVIKLVDLEELDKVKDECSGYVTVNHSSPPVYKAYISCGDKYTTEGYNSSLA